MKPFQDKKSLWWILGVAAAFAALFVAYFVVPASAPGPDGGPSVEVPRMENVPPRAAERMKLEAQEEE